MFHEEKEECKEEGKQRRGINSLLLFFVLAVCFFYLIVNDTHNFAFLVLFVSKNLLMPAWNSPLDRVSMPSSYSLSMASRIGFAKCVLNRSLRIHVCGCSANTAARARACSRAGVVFTWSYEGGKQVASWILSASSALTARLVLENEHLSVENIKTRARNKMSRKYYTQTA